MGSCLFFGVEPLQHPDQGVPEMGKVKKFWAVAPRGVVKIQKKLSEVVRLDLSFKMRGLWYSCDQYSIS